MHFFIAEHFHTAKASIGRTRTRTALTILGVAIGVASITAILSLSEGITQIVNQQISNVNSSLLVVRPNTRASSIADLGNPTPSNAYSTSPLTEEDVAFMKQLKYVKAVAPLMTLSGSVRTPTEQPNNTQILATTPDFTETTNVQMDDGQFIDSVTLTNTAVIGQQLSIDLFGTAESVGKTFYIRGQRFTCIGVLKRQDQPINYNSVDLDHAAIISLTSGKLFNEGVAQIQQINVEADTPAHVSAVKKSLMSTLVTDHSGEHDSTVLSGSDIAKPTSKLFLIINVVISIIASISLLVGGIGIMNIMLVSVTERTREIGLRKAVGASNGAVIGQFMIEALIISFLGGLIGYLAGYGAAFIISWFLPYDPAINWQIAGWALGLSLSVGVIFGLYPAVRAARKNPIESLRRYH